MIVEKIYTNSTETRMSESDILKIKTLLEKYNTSDIFDVLNEEEERRKPNKYKASISSKYDSTGGSTVRGIGGIIQSVPSFALSMLLSPTLTALAGLGALSHRIRQRWEDKQSWRNRLRPSFWIDNLANPGNFSIPHRAIAGTAGLATVAASAALGPLAWEKLKNRADELKDNAPKWMKKLMKFGAAAGVAGAVMSKDSSKNGSEDYEELTPEDVKNIDFKEYWLTFSNGEIFRVKADTPNHAKDLGSYILTVALLPKGRYAIMNDAIKNQNLKRFEFYFDDGEMCYSAGKDQKDALRCAMDYRNEICKQLNDSDKGLMSVDPLSEPNVYGASAPKVGAEIPLPERNKIKVSADAPKRKELTKKTLKVPVYAYEGMSDYKVSFMNCNLHFPAVNEREVPDMVKNFSKYYAKSTLSEIDSYAKKHQRQFKVKMGDGDYYWICAPDENTASSLSLKIQKAKIESALRVLQKKDPLENFLAEYGDAIKKVTVSEVRKEDYKEYKTDNKVGIKKIASSKDDTEITYDKYYNV